MAPLIRVHGLAKEFRRPRHQPGRFSASRTLLTRQVEVTRAVDGMDLCVGKGDLLGYMDPNGVGKSPTIRACSIRSKVLK